METLYQLSSEKALKQFKTSLTGLQDEAILILQKEFGENALTETKQKSKWLIPLAQFTDMMIIIILIIAAIISFVSGEHLDAYVIVAIIIASAWMGFTQQYNAEN